MRVRLISSIFLVFAVMVGLVRADIPKAVSYQGKVTDSGGSPVADGNYTMRFSIYNAPTGGTVQWDSGNQTIAVNGGVFSVVLGESLMPALDILFNEDYWLEVRFDDVTQSPRQQLVATGYAYMASGLVAGTQVYGAVISESYSGLQVINQASTGATYGLNARSLSTAGSGVYGEAMASSGTNHGVYGRSASDTGRGVYGEASHSTGPNYGIYGYSASIIGIGVYGKVGGGAQVNYGVHGTSSSAFGRGVYGSATSTVGESYGVYGSNSSTEGCGVFGKAWTTTGYTKGVYGEASSEDGSGVRGSATSTSGICFGGRFSCVSSNGIGVRGKNIATTGTATGVYGWSKSTNGRGVEGLASATSGISYGVYGVAKSAHGRGVYGFADATSGTNFGVYGESGSTTGRGVYGRSSVSTGTTYGVYGFHFSTAGAAGYFHAENNSSSSIASGVVGRCDVDGTENMDACGVAGHAYHRGVGVGAWSNHGHIFRGYEGHYPTGNLRYYFMGNGWAYADGGWASFLTGKDGDKKFIYAVESPGIWVEDFGTATLTDGRVSVPIAPDFLGAVSTADDYHIFLTPLGPNTDLYVATKESDRFEVRAMGSKIDVSFDYKIVARRAGLRKIRMNEVAQEGDMERID